MSDLTAPTQPPLAATTLKTFPIFPLLPTEIRLSIWTLSLLPRTLELHSQRAHYANPHNTSAPSNFPGPPPFQSRCYNPALLSTNLEARTAALEIYTIALPLASETHHRPPSDQRRVLYIAPDRDTVVLLGYEPAIKVTRLVGWFREHLLEKAGASECALGRSITGLRNIGVSAAQFANSQGAQMLKFIGRDVFYDVEQFVLVIGPMPGCGTEQKPPEGWDGGRCMLRELSEGEEGEGGEDEMYRGFQWGVGRQFKEREGWMVVGRNRMRVASVYFENGW
ncbi:hypothetical protein V497_02749 [Pseudogymnoascus sp. VKM F-4516 (FW-969)]|nr:hypothetical protein V497_02749 [Pseudogymnoascus sp. VKM F-4516 (FW-969)]